MRERNLALAEHLPAVSAYDRTSLVNHEEEEFPCAGALMLSRRDTSETVAIARRGGLTAAFEIRG